VRALELRVRIGAGASLPAVELVRRDLDDPEARSAEVSTSTSYFLNVCTRAC
jgi:hypothetical protein